MNTNLERLLCKLISLADNYGLPNQSPFIQQPRELFTIGTCRIFSGDAILDPNF